MKLHWSPRSPFVRKVMIVAHETGLASRIACVRTVAIMNEPNPLLLADNPLNKIPTLVLDDGTALYDSRVICEYLDTLHTQTRLFPPAGNERLTALRRQALGDGLLDLLVLWRNERNRPPEKQSSSHLAAFATKFCASLSLLEGESAALANAEFGIGHIAIGCALSYLDFRFAAENWRDGHPRLAAWHAAFEARPSAKATEIIDA